VFGFWVVFFFKATLELAESVLPEQVIILKDLSRDSNIRGLGCFFSLMTVRNAKSRLLKGLS